jgi:Arm DNA-binding domain
VRTRIGLLGSGSWRARSTSSAQAVATLSRPGRHSDGGGLYLAIDKGDEALRHRWVFLFRWKGKLVEMGLGGLGSVSLAKARELATECRSDLADGVNPKQKRDKARNDAAGIPTFGACADEIIEAKVQTLESLVSNRSDPRESASNSKPLNVPGSGKPVPPGREPNPKS